jgi:hypothetical protein
MTQKIYKTAKGKTIDIGALRLQNENVRAVGNMGVNARGDRIDSEGKVIDSRSRQLQRQVQRQSNVSDGPVHSSKKAADAKLTPDIPTAPTAPDVAVAPPVEVPGLDAVNAVDAQTEGGLAGAIARSKKLKAETKK